MVPKNRIHLSRSLHAQTTPYPDAKHWLRRGAIVSIVILAIGVYFFNAEKHPPSPLPLPKQILGEQELVQQVEYFSYIVKKGDTLFNLSQRYDVSWQTLAELNHLKEPYVLKIGQEIKIPAAPPEQ